MEPPQLPLGLSLTSASLPQNGAESLLQVLKEQQLQDFFKDYLGSLLTEPLSAEAAAELRSLMSACPDFLLPCWLELPEEAWTALIDHCKAFDSLYPPLALLLRLLSARLSPEDELPKGLPGLAFLFRVYGPSLLRKRLETSPGTALTQAWRHLLAQGSSSRWPGLLADSAASEAPENVAARDLQLALLLRELPAPEPPKDAVLRWGADDYLARCYGDEERLLDTHAAAITKKICAEDEEGQGEDEGGQGEDEGGQCEDWEGKVRTKRDKVRTVRAK